MGAMNARKLATGLRHAAVLPLLAVLRRAPSAAALHRDARRLHQSRLDLALPEELSTAEALDALSRREFRSVLYLRLEHDGGAWALLALVLRRIWGGQVALEISCDAVGPGLYVSHGFATIVIAGRLGADCLISQQVTVGYSDRGGPPTFGDRVRIGAGAMVLGPVHVGSDAVIGAGAVVVADVPAGKVVAGVPARVIEHAEDRFSARNRAAG
jgi:serine O-acetyltransferase